MLKLKSKKDKSGDSKQSKNLDAEKFIKLKYLQKMRDHKISYFGVISFLIGSILSSNLIPIVYSGFVQRIIQGGYANVSGMAGVLLLLAFLYAAAQFLIAISDLIALKVSKGIQVELFQESHRILSLQSSSFYANNFSGGLVSKIERYAIGFQGVQRAYQFQVIPTVITGLFMLAYVMIKSLLLSIPFFLIIFFYGLLVFTTKKKRKILSKKSQKLATKFRGKFSDSIISMNTVKAEGAERRELSKLKAPLEDMRKALVKSNIFGNVTSRVSTFLANLFILMSLVFAAILYINGSIELATVLITTSYSSSLVNNISRLAETKLRLQDIYSETYEMAEIMMQKPEIQDPKIPTNLKINQGLIEFNNASFKYSDSSESIEDEEAASSEKRKKDKPEQHLFKNLNLIIQPGEKIGLVGPSGGGKSTLLKLILRFYDVDSGEVKIDGINVKDVIQSKLRQQIAYVPQDPALFHRSILENIGYSKPKATKKQIESAAHQAFADEFINDLPKGYDTLVGERGVKLSGGQRQRVAIARAILKDAPILLLDEATSALDSESEKYIQKSLQKLIKGRTTVVVAHRLSTIQNMDRILVIEKGRVVDSGSHRELLSSSPLYQKLWSHQSGGILQD